MSLEQEPKERRTARTEGLLVIYYCIHHYLSNLQALNSKDFDWNEKK